MTPTNLPTLHQPDSALGTRLYFDAYSAMPVELQAVDVDAAIAFFTGQGFKTDAAQVIALAILKQAKMEGKPVYSILETLVGPDQVKLSEMVANILNKNRVSTSILGYRVSAEMPPLIKRNIRP